MWKTKIFLKPWGERRGGKNNTVKIKAERWVVVEEGARKGCVCVRSVVSNSLQPHGLQPTSILCPWNSPGKNTGVGCYFLLQGIFLTQGSNSSLLHCRQVLYQLSLQESPSDEEELKQMLAVEQDLIAWMRIQRETMGAMGNPIKYQHTEMHWGTSEYMLFIPPW